MSHGGQTSTRAKRPSTWLVVAALLSLYVFWGSTYLGIRWSVLGGVPEQPGTGMPPFVMAGVRNLIAGVVMYAFLRLVRREAKPTAVHWRTSAVVGTLLLLGGNGLVTFASQYIPSGIAALLIAMLPIWMLVLEGPWGGSPLRERATPAQLGGMAIGLCGVGMLVWPRVKAAMAAGSHESDVRLQALGAGAVMLSSFLWANGSLLSRRETARGRSPASALVATAMQLICGGISLLVVATLKGEWGALTAEAVFSTPRPVLSLVYLIVFGSLVGYTAYIWLLGVTTPAKVATYAYVNPVVAVVLGAWIGKETLTWQTMVAAAVIIAGTMVIVTFRGGGARGRGAGGTGQPAVVAEEEVPVLTCGDGGGEEQPRRG